MLWCDESLQTQAQGMHREALLEECAAGVSDRHQRVASAATQITGQGRSERRRPLCTGSRKNTTAF
jgi:hypothetical protein